MLGIPLVVAGGVTGAALLGRHALRTRQPLPTYGRVPAFTLTDQTGRPVSQDVLRGSVWIADLIFTRCAGQCPMMTAQMARLASALRAEPAVKLVSITVDPEHDTPDVLARYANAANAAAGQWLFVTGERATIEHLCRDGFRLALAEGEGTPQEPITHSSRFVLVDREGGIRGYYDATDPHALNQLRRDLQSLLESPPFR